MLQPGRDTPDPVPGAARPREAAEPFLHARSARGNHIKLSLWS